MSGDNALWEAVTDGKIENVRQLLEAGSDVEEKGHGTANSPSSLHGHGLNFETVLDTNCP